MAQYNIHKGIPALILKISEKVNLVHPLHDADISGWRMIETTKTSSFDIKKRVFGSPPVRKALGDKLKCINVAIFASDDWLICCGNDNVDVLKDN